MARMIGDLDDLAATVEHRARGEAREKEAAARRLAKRVGGDAEEEAEQVRREMLDEARMQAEQMRREQMAGARQQAKRQRLEAREDCFDAVWQQAEERLRELVNGDGYADVLRQLAWQAVEVLGPGRFVLVADPRGHDLLTDERLNAWNDAASQAFGAPVSFERAAAPADTWGGLVAKEAESRRRLDATFPTRLDLAREEIREAVFAQLRGTHE